LHPPNEDVIVIGPGFVATDGFDEAIVKQFAVVVQMLNLAHVRVTARPEVRERVGRALSDVGVSSIWDSGPVMKLAKFLRV